jgi:hypothetical protein
MVPIVKAIGCLWLFGQAGLIAAASDWPQLQADASRTGRSSEEIAPPYRARWIWFGDSGTLRNRLSRPNDPAWTNDLSAGIGRSYPMPASVNFTLGGMMQPIICQGLVLAASQEGKVFAIREEDGSTAWASDLPGGSIATGAAMESVVVFCSIKGGVHGFDLKTGKQLWEVQTGKAISGAPCVVGNRIYVANHSRQVHAIDGHTGQVLWKSERLGGFVQGSLAADNDAVYVGAEDMKFYKLAASDGAIACSHQVCGQSFRFEWPVLCNGKAWLRTAPVWCVGSEGVNDTLLASATSLEDEESKYLDWLEGNAVFGSWSSRNDWKSFFALRLSDLSEAFPIPCGPSDGCGQPPDPPAVDSAGNVLCWWPTRFCHLTHLESTFGTRYSIDLAAVDEATGRRQPYGLGKPVEVWPLETDNLYALSTGGRFCYWRQRFRGTYGLDLKNRSHFQIQTEVRDRDGGTWNAPVMYVDTRETRLPRTPTPAAHGRVGVAIANRKLYIAENYCVTAIEHAE